MGEEEENDDVIVVRSLFVVERRTSWFSQQSVDSGSGSNFYVRADGTEVEVTAVNMRASDYEWPDKEDRGEVTRWSRTGTPSDRARDADLVLAFEP